MAEKDILITDSLFIDKTNEEELKRAGFHVTRLDKPEATEEELIVALKGKHGYILGGVEKCTKRVIDSTDSLEAIVFAGAGYQVFIPAWEEATKKGIAIANAPGRNAASVAEYTVTMILVLLRNLFELGRIGTKKFETTMSVRDAIFGIVGMGNVGKMVAYDLKALGAKQILYYNRSRKPELEESLGIKYKSLEELLKDSDVVTLHASKEAGEKYIGTKELKMMKNGAILINASFASAVDFDALKKEIKEGRLKAAYDTPPDGKYDDLPIGGFFTSNSEAAYNTKEALATVSSMVTKSMINLLKSGEDEYLVNPEYKEHKKSK